MLSVRVCVGGPKGVAPDFFFPQALLPRHEYAFVLQKGGQLERQETVEEVVRRHLFISKPF